ncbi:hypothetical protein [Halorussus aquaticus]|uniref:CARDB protein n=1 Tax=Halorussus aquaticus TaxID=2953748 RepID=A0ABD5PYY9_9EURY|nr:hypothetical protein [Halorussus aquaticus]
MNWKTSYVVALMILALLTCLQVGAIDTGYPNNTETPAEVSSSGGVEYRVSLDANASTVLVEYENPSDDEIEHARYSITVDKQRVYAENFNLSEGEHRTKRINITSGINVNRDEHTVTFSTFGGHAYLNFTRDIDSADSGQIPTPYISDVNVTKGTVDGEPSAVAKVTLVNPSDQLYGTKLMVHTTGTDGSYYPASVRPGDSRTITVELLDGRDAKIAGEARLYTGNMTTREGAIDQVEFAGQRGTETRVWDSSYEPVKPTWMDDHYQYHNDSYARSRVEKISGGHEVAGVPLAYLAVAVLVGLVVLRRLR